MFREIEVGALVEEIEELRIADVNGDGMKDIFVSPLGTFSSGVRVDAGIYIYVSRGSQFDPVPLVATTEAVDDFNALDLTGDGIGDLIAYGAESDSYRHGAALAPLSSSPPNDGSARLAFEPKVENDGAMV